MENKAAIDAIRKMYKGNPTAVQLEALELAYVALRGKNKGALIKNKLAYICSPYRGNAYQRIRNVAYARHITKAALGLGYTPIATHLYLPQLLNDGMPAQRRRGLKAGKDILRTCGTIIIGARYGISEGMAAEIRAAAGKDAIIII